MKRVFGLFVLIVLISSCKKDIVLSSNENKLVNQISKNKTLINKDDLLYHQFKDSFTTDKLVFLTEHKNPKIRCLAFSILAEKDYPDIQKVFFDHAYDSIEYVSFDGICGSSAIKVNRFMLLELYPTSGCKYRFDKKEFDYLYKKHIDFNNVNSK